MNSGCGARFCPRCQASLDAQPLGAFTRRWSAEYADATGMMSGLLCDSCKSLVRKNNARVSSGESMFHFVDPNRPGGAGAGSGAVGDNTKHQVALAMHAVTTTDFARLSTTEQNVLHCRHEQEVGERLRWCLDRGLTPAHEHIHAAPGDDAKFMVVFYMFSLTAYFSFKGAAITGGPA
jgi:hypothetical protein